ncbi:hypothetical protein BDN67DRAFT_790711 [Paxillus ammoniavirescens]|nr:hypothetical protein BDN67DRAFT_790711 [Paxillus ammoniavirescens]
MAAALAAASVTWTIIIMPRCGCRLPSVMYKGLGRLSGVQSGKVQNSMSESSKRAFQDCRIALKYGLVTRLGSLVHTSMPCFDLKPTRPRSVRWADDCPHPDAGPPFPKSHLEAIKVGGEISGGFDSHQFPGPRGNHGFFVLCCTGSTWWGWMDLMLS